MELGARGLDVLGEKMSSLQAPLPVLEAIVQTDKPLLISAEDADVRRLRPW